VCSDPRTGFVRLVCLRHRHADARLKPRVRLSPYHMLMPKAPADGVQQETCLRCTLADPAMTIVPGEGGTLTCWCRNAIRAGGVGNISEDERPSASLPCCRLPAR
jgi:hypothetical protein